MNSAPDQLPQIAAIFRGIKAGKHWCFGDPEYDDLNGALFERYQAFFSQLDLKLHRDGRGFVFATSDDDDYKGSDLITRFVVFTAVWVDAVADSGEDIGKALFARNQVIADLPHFVADSHRRLLKQVGIENVAELTATLRSMERLGFVEIDGSGRFSLRVSFHRILDVCRDEAAAPDAPTTTEPEPNGNEEVPA